MSFKKYGGMAYSAKNNIVNAQYSNIAFQNVTTQLGTQNARIEVVSQIDMADHSIVRLNQLTFNDGTMQNTAYDVNITGQLAVNNVYNLNPSAPLTFTANGNGIYLNDDNVYANSIQSQFPTPLSFSGNGNGIFINDNQT